jgi:hypothetical protein
MKRWIRTRGFTTGVKRRLTRARQMELEGPKGEGEGGSLLRDHPER